MGKQHLSVISEPIFEPYLSIFEVQPGCLHLVLGNKEINNFLDFSIFFSDFFSIHNVIKYLYTSIILMFVSPIGIGDWFMIRLEEDLTSLDKKERQPVQRKLKG